MRYIRGQADDNAVLKLALLKVWGWRCHLCRTPREFGEVEIDHLLPHSLPAAELEKLLRAHVIPPPRTHGFDVHTAYNLAPICRPCNGDKRDMNLAGSDMMTVRLEKARRVAPQVEAFVRSFRSSNIVTKAILAVSTADLSDMGSRDALLQFGPLVVNRLGLLAPSMLTEYKSVHQVDDPTEVAPSRVLVTLDEAGRRARVILEDVVGQNFDEALRVLIRRLEREIDRRVEIDISSEFDQDTFGEPTVGPPAGRKFIEIDTMTYNRHDEIFGIHGRFDVDLSSLVAIVGIDGSTDYVQSDATAHGTFTAEFGADVDKLRSDDFVITDWRRGPAPW